MWCVLLGLVTLVVVLLLIRRFRLVNLFLKKTSVFNNRANGKAGSGEGSAEWFNQTVSWLHNHHQQHMESWRWVSDAWIKSLSDEIKAHAPPDLTVRLDGDHRLESQPPKFTNFSTNGSTSQALILKTNLLLSDCSLLAYIISKRANNISSVKCEVKLHQLLGELKARIDEDRESNARMTVSFASKPDIKLEVIPSTHDVEIDKNLVERVICDAFSSLVLHLPLNGLSCGQQSPEIFERSHEMKQNAMLQNKPVQKKKLLVKVIKANGLSDSGLSEPFCVVNIDNPPQRQATSSVRNTAHPFFDEHFMFELNNLTRTVAFEMRDRTSTEGNSLGRAELTLDEITKSENCRHVLPLTGKSATYGSLTVEVVALDDGDDSIASMTPNVEHIYPSKTGNSSLQDSGISLSGGGTAAHYGALEAALGSGADGLRSQINSSEVQTKNTNLVPRIETLPPKGDSKKKSFATAIKNRFRRKKDPRSKSADRVITPGQSADLSIGEGIYLTPPPPRSSATPDFYNGPSNEGELSRNRSNSVRSTLRRIFHKKEKSPSRVSNPRDSYPSREGSTGQPSPVLKSYCARSLDDTLPSETRSRASTVSAI